MALTALMQEPWCFHPEQVATLTDDQIWNRYLQPAIERAERLKSDAPAPTGRAPLGPRSEPSTGPPGEPGSPEHRAAIVGAFMTVMGMSRDKAHATYDKQLAQWEAEQHAAAAQT